jgi:hypothetical protein
VFGQRALCPSFRNEQRRGTFVADVNRKIIATKEQIKYVLRRPADSTESDANLPGLINTIGTAYAELNRRPYLIAIPVILDLYLWIGMRPSARPLTDFLERWLQLGQSSNATALESIRTFGQQFDLFSLLTLTTPTLINDSIQVARLGAGQNPAISGLPWWMIPLLMVVLALIGIGLLYLTLIGYLVRGDRLTISALILRTFHNILRMYGFILVVFDLMLLVTTPVLIVGIIFFSIGVNLMPMLAMFLMLASLWRVSLLFLPGMRSSCRMPLQCGPSSSVTASCATTSGRRWC